MPERPSPAYSLPTGEAAEAATEAAEAAALGGEVAEVVEAVESAASGAGGAAFGAGAFADLARVAPAGLSFCKSGDAAPASRLHAGCSLLPHLQFTGFLWSAWECNFVKFF